MLLDLVPAKVDTLAPAVLARIALPDIITEVGYCKCCILPQKLIVFVIPDACAAPDGMCDCKDDYRGDVCQTLKSRKLHVKLLLDDLLTVHTRAL